jgi:hypothetical protein
LHDPRDGGGEMTDEQINVVIAEHCGWECLGFDVWHHGRVGYHKGMPDVRSKIPDYCNDLNAMHEAELELIYGKGTEYAEYLLEVTNRHWTCDIEFFSANARQRAEAFLRTLGKWEERK